MKLVGRLYEKSLWVRWRQSLPVTVTSLFSCVIDMEVSAHPQQCHPSPSPTLLHLTFQEEKAQWHKEAPALAHSFLKISKWCKRGMMEVGRENGLHIIWNKNSSPTFLQLHKMSILIVLQLDASTSTNSGPGGETVEYSVPWAESSTTASRKKCRSDLLHPYWLLWKDWDFPVDYWWKCWSLQLWKRACRMKQSAPLSQSFPHRHHSGLCEYYKIHFYFLWGGTQAISRGQVPWCWGAGLQAVVSSLMCSSLVLWKSSSCSLPLTSLQLPLLPFQHEGSKWLGCKQTVHTFSAGTQPSRIGIEVLWLSGPFLLLL